MVTRFLIVLFLGLLSAFAAGAQQTAKATSSASIAANAANDIFSGTVTATTGDSLVVVRKVPAHADEPRTFVVDKDTKIEGRLRTNARVTVRFKADAEGAQHALRVIVRADSKSTTGAGKSQRGNTTK